MGHYCGRTILLMVGAIFCSGIVGGRDLWGQAKTSFSWPVEKRMGIYRLHATFSLPELPEVEQELLSLEKELTEKLEIPFIKKDIHIYLFAYQSSYEAYLKEHFGELPYRRAMYVQGKNTSMVFVYYHPELITDLRHEATHAWLNNSFDSLPLWLDEGLAEYFEAPSAQGRQTKESELSDLFKKASPAATSLNYLKAKANLSDMVHDDYLLAYGWARFVLNEPSLLKSLKNYLKGRLATNPVGGEEFLTSQEVDFWVDSFRKSIHKNVPFEK
ncbi:MAG: DUF1570 domain-containing protein [Pirellulaceae bacterium]|nr:DUF1570 domain-containing protein [Pirellulaceae bacterium]